MKRWIIFLSLAAALAACEEVADNSTAVPNMKGLWSFTILPADPAQDRYTLEVTQAGGSGLAQITVSSQSGDSSGPSTVIADLPVPVGNCGLFVTFGDTVGVPLSLDLGDRWSFAVSGASYFNPAPEPGNSSTVEALTTSGAYTCVAAPCAGGLFGSSLPPAQGIGAPIPMGGGEQREIWGINFDQTGSNLSATVPEAHALTLNLPGATVGDEITVTYSRSLRFGNPAGDFWLVRANNGNEIVPIEWVQAADATDSDEEISLTFTAASVILGVDFVFGTSGPESAILLDSVRVQKNGAAWFSDSFPAAAFANDLAPLGERWEVRSPPVASGGFGLSDVAPLEGGFSVRAEGGTSWTWQGSVLTGAGTLGLNLGGLGGGTGGAMQGVTLEAWETQVYDFLTSLAGIEQAAGTLVGTFRGEPSDHSCLEQGNFLAGEADQGTADVGGTWTLRIDGQAENCGGTVEFGDTLGPFEVTQRSRAFFSDPTAPIVDRNGNSSSLFGTVNGPAALFSWSDFNRVSERTATFAGAVVETTVRGNFTGTLPFMNGRECETNGTFTATVE